MKLRNVLMVLLFLTPTVGFSAINTAVLNKLVTFLPPGNYTGIAPLGIGDPRPRPCQVIVNYDSTTSIYSVNITPILTAPNDLQPTFIASTTLPLLRCAYLPNNTFFNCTMNDSSNNTVSFSAGLTKRPDGDTLSLRYQVRQGKEILDTQCTVSHFLQQ